MRRIIRWIPVIAIAAYFAAGFFPAQTPQAHAGEPRVVAATFRSAWCGACRIIEPRIEAVAEEYAGEPVEFVRFDFSLGQRGRLAELAGEKGIADVYERYSGGTGFMLLIDREAGDVLAMITVRYGEDDIRGAIDHALTLTRERAEFGL